MEGLGVSENHVIANHSTFGVWQSPKVLDAFSLYPGDCHASVRAGSQ